MSNVNLVTCKRCGAPNLAWVQSKKTGRFYLALTQKFHGVQHGNGYSAGGVSVLAHKPHKCDDPHAGGHPVCDKCGKRHSPHSGDMICLVNQRVAALADPQWKSRTPGRWQNLTRHSLNAGDFTAEVEHDTETGEILLSVWLNGQVYSQDGVIYNEVQMPTVDEAKAKALKLMEH
jgi:hypothetical protein